jgi:peptide-methionine (S)-S-oxide reductase
MKTIRTKWMAIGAWLGFVGVLGGCASLALAQATPKTAPTGYVTKFGVVTPAAPAGLAKATFAGGCFWCMEQPFDELPGVIATTSGYTGGPQKKPTYQEVSGNGTDHIESVEILYDPAKITYAKLLEVFWRNVDPTVKNAQFCDHGSHYRTAIFTHDAAQAKLAQESKETLLKNQPYGSAKPIGVNGKVVTELLPAAAFWPAEDYHQDYYVKNPLRYKYYRNGCGRDARLQQLWGK